MRLRIGFRTKSRGAAGSGARSERSERLPLCERGDDAPRALPSSAVRSVDDATVDRAVSLSGDGRAAAPSASAPLLPLSDACRERTPSVGGRPAASTDAVRLRRPRPPGDAARAASEYESCACAGGACCGGSGGGARTGAFVAVVRRREAAKTKTHARTASTPKPALPKNSTDAPLTAALPAATVLSPSPGKGVGVAHGEGDGDGDVDGDGDAPERKTTGDCDVVSEALNITLFVAEFVGEGDGVGFALMVTVGDVDGDDAPNAVDALDAVELGLAPVESEAVGVPVALLVGEAVAVPDCVPVAVPLAVGLGELLSDTGGAPVDEGLAPLVTEAVGVRLSDRDFDLVGDAVCVDV